jgi:hypothetical protein
MGYTPPTIAGSHAALYAEICTALMDAYFDGLGPPGRWCRRAPAARVSDQR